ncbi:hypothetical protein V9T40_011352 [Parthenolecanium corni]|uniref:Uncharacterized protein n=1 Tax=Parthenolecanium corni TaxID=536013 RepID=A0AAN9T6X9_9HEMI
MVEDHHPASEFGSPFLIKLSAFGLPVFPSKINGFRLLAFGFQLASELCPASFEDRSSDKGPHSDFKNC